jgi:hypothetical protein
MISADMPAEPLRAGLPFLLAHQVADACAIARAPAGAIVAVFAGLLPVHRAAWPTDEHVRVFGIRQAGISAAENAPRAVRTAAGSNTATHARGGQQAHLPLGTADARAVGRSLARVDTRRLTVTAERSLLLAGAETFADKVRSTDRLAGEERLKATPLEGVADVRIGARRAARNGRLTDRPDTPILRRHALEVEIPARLLADPYRVAAQAEGTLPMSITGLPSLSRTSGPTDVVRSGRAHASRTARTNKKVEIVAGLHADVLALPGLSAELTGGARTVNGRVTWSSSPLMGLGACHQQQP